MELSSFTRRLEACRKRWNSRSLQFVLAIARIIRGARRAAVDERRWGQWVRHETRMSRTTVHRYLRVAEYVRANVSLKRQLATLGIFKVYALSRLSPNHALQLIKSGEAARLSEVAFLRLISRLRPKSMTRPTLPNITRALRAALVHLDRSVRRWESAELSMPPAIRLEIESKLKSMTKVLERIRRNGAAAM